MALVSWSSQIEPTKCSRFEKYIKKTAPYLDCKLYCQLLYLIFVIKPSRLKIDAGLSDGLLGHSHHHGWFWIRDVISFGLTCAAWPGMKTNSFAKRSCRKQKRLKTSSGEETTLVIKLYVLVRDTRMSMKGHWGPHPDQFFLFRVCIQHLSAKVCNGLDSWVKTLLH